MAKVPREERQRKPKDDGSGESEGNPAADFWSLPTIEDIQRELSQSQRLQELLRAWREASAPDEGPKPPKPYRFLPWLQFGHSEEDYPPPEQCTPEDGRLLYGIYYDLWKLGVPLDFSYPDFHSNETESEAARYEQEVKQPLIRKARELVAQLERTVEKLLAAEKVHPRYRRIYSTEPHLQFSEVREFSGIRSAAWFAKEWLARVGHVRKGRRVDRPVDETVKGLRSLGLSQAKIAKAIKILGLEGASYSAEHVRQRLRRGTPPVRSSA
jgi:hypothetical protein